MTQRISPILLDVPPMTKYNFMPTSENYSINQKGLTHILILIMVVGITLFVGAFFWSNFKNGHFINKPNQPAKENEQSSSTSKQSLISGENKSLNQKEEKSYNTVDNIYPNTDDPPKLTLFFGEDKKQNIPDEDVLSIGQFGSWEGGGPPTPFKQGFEPNSEMEISLKAKQYPVYAFTKGIITYIEKGNSGEITVRYGRKYTLKHLHVSNPSEKLKVGEKIEAGDFIGYTPIIKAGINDPRGEDFSFLEIELDKVISDRSARAINAFDYFDETSKAGLEKVRLGDKTGVKPDWVGTTIDKSKSWIPYVRKAETWADMHKIGFEGDLESFEEFAKNNNLEWVLNN